MHLQESGEMYLETIYILTKKNHDVRSLDVAEYMNFSKPSVSRAVGLLKQGEYITVDQEGYLHLTAMGEEIAAKMYERHMLLTEFLIRLGVDRETLDACSNMTSVTNLLKRLNDMSTKRKLYHSNQYKCENQRRLFAFWFAFM